MKRVLIFLLIIPGLYARGQGLEEYLSRVSENHPAIIICRDMLKVSEAESRTGIYPDNPEVSFGYFPGIPEAIGDKLTWSVSQSMDFLYRLRRIREIKSTDFELAVLEADQEILNIMSHTREAAIEFITLQKQLKILDKRLKHLKTIEKSYVLMAEAGEATIIERNKVQRSRASLEADYSDLLTEISTYKDKLDLFSGGESSLLADSAFPIIEDPELEELTEEKSTLHPAWLIPIHRISQAKDNLRYTKAGNMPEIKIGVASEVIAAQQFTGPTVGVSLPLWKNKGMVNAAQTTMDQRTKASEGEIALLELQLKEEYAEYQLRKKNMNMLIAIGAESDNTLLLSTALKAGEISLIDFFIELSELYELEDRLLEEEKLYKLAYSRLVDHHIPR